MSIVYAGHVFMGVDPGASGAAVTVGPIKQSCRFSKTTHIEIFNFFEEIARVCYGAEIDLTAILEKVTIMPTDGRASGAKFLHNAGMLYGYLGAARIRLIEVTPVVWQRKMGRIDPKGTPKTKKKQRNQELAQHLYPDRKVIRETADAFLLAEYGRRFHQ